MDLTNENNVVVHISSKSHLNLTFNLYRCGRTRLSPSEMLPIREEDCFTFVYINEGNALLQSASMTFQLASQQGFFAFPDLPYVLQNASAAPMVFTWLTFSGYQVEHYLNRADMSRTRPTFTDPQGIVLQKFEVIYQAAHKLPNRYCRMVSGLYAIFSHLLDITPIPRSDDYSDGSDFFALKAVNYIEQNYNRPLLVDEIAETLGISRKALYAIFRNVLKISPNRFVILYRMEKACMRLRLSSQSISEIAYSVGYANQFYFAREFRRLIGMTPSAYRRNPQPSEVFTYRAFVPTLQAEFRDNLLDLPVTEDIISIYAPPQPVRKRSAKAEET